MEVGNIIKGHVNELLGLNKDISQIRLEICKQCPLYLDGLRPRCNPNLYMNPKTRDISLNKKDDYYRGCGCYLKAKTTLPNAVCPVEQW